MNFCEEFMYIADTYALFLNIPVFRQVIRLENVNQIAVYGLFATFPTPQRQKNAQWEAAQKIALKRN